LGAGILALQGEEDVKLLRSLTMRVLRSWNVWVALITGAFLAYLAASYPGIWWVMLLWMLPAGAAVGQARYPTATPPPKRDSN